MTGQAKYMMGEDRIPRSWYNIMADLPAPPPPVLHPGTGQPVGPDDLSPLFPMALIGQEVSQEREIEIPAPVRDVYRMWRPTPLYRAHGLEKALGTSARIFYKYEGVSPAGSHKPNTAVAQAFYNKEAGVAKLSTETGAGQWGSSLAFAGALFGLEVKVYMVKVSYDQKPYRRALMETYGAKCVASPSDETESGRAISQKPSGFAGQPWHRNFRGGGGRGQEPGHEICSGFRAEPRAAASERHRDRGDRADGNGRRLPGRRHRLCGRRLQLRRHRLSVHRQEAARQTKPAGHRSRAGGVPVPDPGQIRIRFRRHRASHSAGQDAYAGVRVHPARLPRGWAALSRDGAAGQPLQGTGA